MTEHILTKEQIIAELKTHKKKLVNLGVAKIGLFGSYVRNTQVDESDIDLLVEFKTGHKNFSNFMNLIFFLEDLFNKEIELVTAASLSPYLAPAIMKEVEYVSFAA